MAVKQRGSNQKKRSQQRQQSIEKPSASLIRFSAPSSTVPAAVPEVNALDERTAGLSLMTEAGDVSTSIPLLSHVESFSSARSGQIESAQQTGKAMQSRREFVFACLVGHKVSVILRDGAEINGVFALHGNQAVLPQSWGSEPKPSDASSPQPENAYVYVRGGFVPRDKSPVADDLDESTEWFTTGRRKRTQKKGPFKSSEESQDDGTSSSSSLTGTGKFELYHSEARTANIKQACLWLRCAYRVAGITAKSSQVFDWLAIPWCDIVSLEGENIPDNPDAYRSRSLLLGFHTDSEIARAGPMIERPLEKWDADDGFDLSGLDESAVLSWPTNDKMHRRGSTGWDQFECNAKKFGIQSTYVEGMYSTDLDVNTIPEDYQKHAEKIADEVESSNGRRLRGRHMYRSDDEEDMDDEEARFSAVAGTGRYSGKTFGLAGRGMMPNQEALSKFGGRRVGGRGRGRPDLCPSLASNSRNLADAHKLRQLQQSTSKNLGHVENLHLKRQCTSYSCSERKPNTLPSNEGSCDDQETYAIKQHEVKNADASAHAQQAKAVEKPQDGTEASQRNLKDNLNALNLEPTKTKKAVAIVKASYDTVVTRHKTRTEEFKKDRRQMIEQLMACSRKIDDNLARKGWAPRESLLKASPLGSGTSIIAQTPSANDDGTSFHESSNLLPNHEDNNAKRCPFQFNPNANSFTPKGNAAGSPAVKPTTHERQESVPSVNAHNHCKSLSESKPIATFLPFHTPTAETRRKSRFSDETADAEENVADRDTGFLETFIHATHAAAKLQIASNVTPEWESRMSISYLDLLSTPHCSQNNVNGGSNPTISPPAPTLVHPPAVTETSQPTAPCMPQVQPQLNQQTQSFPQMAPAMFSFPAAMRPVFPQAAFNPTLANPLDPNQPAMQVYMAPAPQEPGSAATMYNPATFASDYLNVTAYNQAALNQLQHQQKQHQAAIAGRGQVDINEVADISSGKRAEDCTGNCPTAAGDKNQEIGKSENTSEVATSEEANMMQGLHSLAAQSQMPLLFAQQQSLLPPTATFPPHVYLMCQQQAAFLQQQALQQLKHTNALLPQQPVTLVNPMQFLHQPPILARSTATDNVNVSRQRNTQTQASLVGVPLEAGQHVPCLDQHVSGSTEAGTNAINYAPTQDTLFGGYAGPVHMSGVFSGHTANMFPNVRNLYWQQ